MERTRRSRDESCSLERGHHKRKRKRSRSDSSSRERKKKHTRPRKLKSKKSKKRKRDVGLSDSDTDSSSDSDFSSSGESSGSSSSHIKHRKKKKMKTKKAKKKTDFKMKRKRKHKHGKQVEKEKGKQVSERPGSDINRTMVESKPTPNLKAMIAAQTSKVRGPMTKEEYEKQQSVVRRVFDPDTGRHRLIKGDGEIIEEIVSREQQKAINKKATLGDGYSFQAQMKKFL